MTMWSEQSEKVRVAAAIANAIIVAVSQKRRQPMVDSTA
jgi:hypothetical protein